MGSKIGGLVNMRCATQEVPLSHKLLRRGVRTGRAIRAAVNRPPYVEPGHFYSPLTSDADVARALTWSRAPGVDLAETAQVRLATKLTADITQPLGGPRYKANNRMYGPADGAIYRAMLRHFRPGRVIEVGSGYSTVLALDVADEPGGLPNLQLTCLEPYPGRLRSLLRPTDYGRVSILRQPAQDVDVTVFQELGSGDFLFIDSTHVVKAGSDVAWLFLHVMPHLTPGVIVHVHDLFWPFEYPEQWLRERRDWTEAYLVHAFLSGNAHWEILLFCSWLWQRHPELVPGHLRCEQPGSLWLRRRGEAR
jgi:predicted O-methyltransferase YrrM